jgi:hypothetical protein
MKIKDLIRIISDSYPLDIVDFENEYPNESYCIRENNGEWEVYYSERGQKTGLTKFYSESKACEYLLDKIKRLQHKNKLH